MSRGKDITDPQSHGKPKAEAAKSQADRWIEFRNEFEQLAREQERLEPTPRNHGERQISLLAGGLLRTGGDYSEQLETGEWRYSGAVSENLLERFRTLAARAGLVLGSPPKDTAPEDFWLHRLFLYLRENSSDLLFAASDKGGMILHICEASATFCSRLEKQALELSEADNARHTEPSRAQNSANSAQDGQSKAWPEIEIAFLSDERIEICSRGERKTCNYGELGFEDRRSGKPNRAWVMLRQLAQSTGELPTANIQGKQLAQVQKRIEEIRGKLREHFGIETDPIPFNGTDYQVSFKISCRPSFNT